MLQNGYITTQELVGWINTNLPPMSLSRLRMRLLKDIMNGTIDLKDMNFRIDSPAINRIDNEINEMYNKHLNIEVHDA